MKITQIQRNNSLPASTEGWCLCYSKNAMLTAEEGDKSQMKRTCRENNFLKLKISEVTSSKIN